METFKIEIQELLTRVAEVQAENIQEAFSKVNEQYKKAEVVIDYNDFAEVNFADVNSQSKTDEINSLTKELELFLFDEPQEKYSIELNLTRKYENHKTMDLQKNDVNFVNTF